MTIVSPSSVCGSWTCRSCSSGGSTTRSRRPPSRICGRLSGIWRRPYGWTPVILFRRMPERKWPSVSSCSRWRSEKSTGSDAVHAFDLAGQVALIGEARFDCGVGRWHARGDQPFGMHEPDVAHVRAGRQAYGAMELAGEMIAAQSHLRCHLAGRDISGPVVVQQPAGPSDARALFLRMNETPHAARTGLGDSAQECLDRLRLLLVDGVP